MPKTLKFDADRLFPAEPGMRAIARSLYAQETGSFVDGVIERDAVLPRRTEISGEV